LLNLENNEVKYIDVIDLNNKTIKLPENSNFYVTDENDVNYSTRVCFKEDFGTIENYMKTAYEPVLLEEFNENQLKKDNYNGKFILKIVLDDNTILTHYFTFIGFEDEKTIKVIPVKIPKINIYTVDPTKVLSFNWYYLESNDITEYITLAMEDN